MLNKKIQERKFEKRSYSLKMKSSKKNIRKSFLMKSLFWQQELKILWLQLPLFFTLYIERLNFKSKIFISFSSHQFKKFSKGKFFLIFFLLYFFNSPFWTNFLLLTKKTALHNSKKNQFLVK